MWMGREFQAERTAFAKSGEENCERCREQTTYELGLITNGVAAGAEQLYRRSYEFC